MRIFVIGFMGSDRKGMARRISNEKGYKLIDLDQMIEEKDGRSIQKICMTMGEHEYRNKEYEALQEICKQDNIVVACGDGIVLDEMSRDILKNNHVITAKRPIEDLWEVFKQEPNPPYAFMLGNDESAKKEKFYGLYETRKELYELF